MGTRFTLLGEVGAQVDGRVLEIRQRQQRCLLALLLVDVGRVVSADALVDRMWGERPPRRPREALYSYVSRLRATLAGSVDAAVESRTGGYALVADPAAVDLHRFRALVTGVESAPADEAAAVLAEALGLWSGEPFAGLDSPWLAATRDVLARERLGARLDLVELRLRAGRHRESIAVLAELTAEHPLDERAAAQFMLALYRSGQQREALRHYEVVRRGLADELGVDPSPALRELHQQILTATAAPAPQPDGTPVPRQLPADLPGFTGRDDQLDELDALLAERPDAVVVAALSGTAGVGKTTVAVRWAHRVADRFPDGQLYVNLRGFDPGGTVLDAADAVRGFLDALGVPAGSVPPGHAAQVALYRTMLADRRVLLVLDNARDAAHVRPLLPGTPGCLVVVTSRDDLGGLVATNNARPCLLPVLSAEEAHRLLAERLGARRVNAEPEATADLVARCAGLPLALAVVGARAATRPGLPLASLAAELGADDLGLDGFASGDASTDVRSVFSWSYRALGDGAARAFRLLAVHPGPDFATPAAAALLGVPPAGARRVLAELTRAHLLAEVSPGRFAFHDLLRAYGVDLAEPDEHRAALRRLVEHYQHTSNNARTRTTVCRATEPEPPSPGVVVLDFTDAETALAWFDTEVATVLATIRHATATGLLDEAWLVTKAMAAFLDRRGMLLDSADLLRTGLAATERAGDRREEAAVRQNLGRAHTRAGRYDEARTHLDRALVLNTELGDIKALALTRLGLGRLCGAVGADREALHHVHRALEHFEATGNEGGQSLAHNGIALCHAQLGDYPEALRHAELALAHRPDDSGYLDTIGYVHLRRGDHDSAIECLRRAAELAVREHDRNSEAESCTHLGDAYLAAGDHAAARDAWHRALTVLDRFHAPDAADVRTRLRALAESADQAV